MEKSVFPYKFATQDHLNYIGNTPAIDFYDDLSLEDYSKIYTENWSFRDQTIKYLNNDLNCLFQIILHANKQIFSDYKINIMESVTRSGLAIRIFLSKYYKENIHIIMKLSVYRDIR